MILGLSIALIVLFFDQVSKYFVYSHLLADVNIISYTSFFNLIKAWNTGVSFSMFNDYGSLGAIVLSLCSLIIVGFLFFWLVKEKNKILQTSLGFIIGGAIGNVIDRIRFGAVFDFLDVYYGTYHWPAFNVADSFICIGASIIIIHSMLFAKKEVV